MEAFPQLFQVESDNSSNSINQMQDSAKNNNIPVN